MLVHISSNIFLCFNLGFEIILMWNTLLCQLFVVERHKATF